MWKTGLVTVIEIEFDGDLHQFEVYKGDDRLGVITPASIEDMNMMKQDLDNGECPVADSWEDGMGNICVLEGWGK